MTTIGQNFTVWQGDHKRLIFTVVDVDNLSGADIRWVLAKNITGESIITKKSTQGDITIEGNTFIVDLSPEDTSGLEPNTRYYHESEITDSEGYVSTVASGYMRLNFSLLK